MATSENITPTVAPYPFNLSSADIILRTPDLTEFHVQSFLLIIASPFFSDMLSLPQPQDGNQSYTSTRPIVDVTEDSKTLERLLRLCYPTAKPMFDVLEDIVLVFKAAIKYDMEWAIPPLMKDLKVVLPQNPLKAWAVACRSASEDVAREAALLSQRLASSPLSPGRGH
ncbi:hypothetical protein LXA43DRAFT_973793 [Ganoderma leucocontextum]|nr:hypothetical protein LXA43DRAFT_973793 [Ganoderma leucocontextum]